MASAGDLPDDIDALKAALLAANDRATQVEAELAVAKARASDDQALIAHQQLQIAKLTRELYGQHSERSVRLLDQMELAFEELESSATEDELAAERAAAKTTNVVAFTRQRPARQPFPEHLPRERVVEQPLDLPMLRRCAAAQAGRGYYRDAGGDPATVEGYPAHP
jgi:transposase